MKKITLLLLTIITFYSCHKNEVIDDKKQTTEETFGYIAYNGKRASVTFKKSDKENTINILSNGKTFNLDYQKDTEHGKLYSRNGIDAETRGDSLYIRSGSTVIELAKVK